LLGGIKIKYFILIIILILLLNGCNYVEKKYCNEEKEKLIEADKIKDNCLIGCLTQGCIVKCYQNYQKVYKKYIEVC